MRVLRDKEMGAVAVVFEDARGLARVAAQLATLTSEAVHGQTRPPFVLALDPTNQLSAHQMQAFAHATQIALEKEREAKAAERKDKSGQDFDDFRVVI